ncbi:major outer membrane protein [Legionella birminghamensis]|uniref:Major outer membrane protein n=1 Tax=Legionella birminghamensis TaxID=28083 RepID=A0A378IDD0_9GAMM|nr:Lpg1974 family pore-forming outer membrane protein [Legionella birminghamensis]KTC68849.1 major outer membrane protein [Legionella birminghamensis]STX33209.1 major outer membrane protein [Legionella birminghamensis]
MKGLYQLIIAAGLQTVSMIGIAGEMGEASTAGMVFIPALKPGFELSVSALFLKPEADNLGWSANTTVFPIPNPQWQINAIEPDFDTGFHLGARYVFPNSGTDIQANWFYLDTRDHDSVVVNPLTQWVSPFSQTGTPPSGGEITGVAFLSSAEANLDFNYNAINLDIGKFVNFGPDLQTRFFTGISGAWIKEELVSTFNGAPTVVFSLKNKSTYQGAGPRLGLFNDYSIYQGLHLVGQVAGSVLFGRLKPGEYQFLGSSSDLALVGIALNQEKLANSSVDQIVPAVDAKLGLSYSHLLHEHVLTFEAGYMGTVYVHPLAAYETNTNVIALDTGSLSTSSVKHVQSNFSVAGPYVTLKLRG